MLKQLKHPSFIHQPFRIVTLITSPKANCTGQNQHNNNNNQNDTLSEDEMKYYKSIRIFKDNSNIELANRILVNKLLHYPIFVNNADNLFKLSSKILGNAITAKIIQNTMGRIFTGGASVSEIMDLAKRMESKGIPVIVDFCCEALEEHQSESYMDKCAKTFEETVSVGSNIARHKISVKLSGLCNLKLLKHFNKVQKEIQNMFALLDSSNQGKITGKQLKDSLVNRYGQSSLTDEDIIEFIKIVLEQKDLDNKSDLEQVCITKLQWRMRVHSFYIDPKKNSLKVTKCLTNLNEEEIILAQNFLRRINTIFSSAHLNNTRVLVDAEQSFIQNAIDSFIEQYQFVYNKSEPIVYTTFQNYLTSSHDRIRYELEKCKAINMPFGIKMVRGAYVYEETRLAKENNTENPICDGFDKTTEMIEDNLKLLIDNLTSRSELLVGSHNKQTVEKIKTYMKDNNIPNNSKSIHFSQLLGLADHITYSLVQQGYSIYKYIPFGEPHIMIPYLIRRAQESFQVLSSVEIQQKLLMDEIYQRNPFRSL